MGSAWIHAHRASQIAGATLALAGFAVALTREETETRAPFEWGSYTFDGDEETAAAERAAVAHGVVGVVVVAVVAAQFALAAMREPKKTPAEDSPKKTPSRKIRDAHVLLGWFATVVGLANCVVGAWLSRWRGTDPREARLFLVVAIVAVAAGGVALVAKVTARRR